MRAGRTCRAWRAPLARRLGELGGELDLILISTPGGAEAGALGNRLWAEVGGAFDAGHHAGRGALHGPRRYLWGLASGAAAGVAQILLPYFNLANIVMLFLLAVVFTAWRYGRGPDALSATVNVAVFDFLFVPPRFSFAVTDAQYLLTFVAMLATGILIGSLTARLRYQIKAATLREEREQSLYEMVRELSGALMRNQVAEICGRAVERSFRAGLPEGLDIGIAQWAYDHGEPAGMGTDTLPSSPLLYLPLWAPMRVRGVLAVAPQVPRWLMVPDQRRQPETFATLVAIALERVHYVEVAQDALVKMESERLRNSLLSALSHDLRTPLTAQIGMADSIAGALAPGPGADGPANLALTRELAQAMRENAGRIGQLVNNLLDMARLESGEVKLRKAWQPLEEVVGSALRLCGAALERQHLRIDLPAGLPLVEFDAVLIERVLCNLLENAAKYCPPGSHI